MLAEVDGGLVEPCLARPLRVKTDELEAPREPVQPPDEAEEKRRFSLRERLVDICDAMALDVDDESMTVEVYSRAD